MDYTISGASIQQASFSKQSFRSLFEIDLRSLALFRVLLALLLLTDLLKRSTDLIAHYTDHGVLPREALQITSYYFTRFLSPFFLTEGPYWQMTLFLVTGVVFIALLLGYRTWFATCLSWFLLISLHDRNPLILHGGDLLLRIMLFWSLFLPLGSTFSLDHLLNNASQKTNSKQLYSQQACSLGTVAFLLQICIVYWAAACYKWNAEWLEGKAVYYAIHLDQFATPLGLWLQQQQVLFPFLTKLTLYIEAFLPFLAFSPFFTGPIRLIVIGAFWMMHLSFGLFLELGLFPYICAVAWVPFLPTWFWEKLPLFKVIKLTPQPHKKNNPLHATDLKLSPIENAFAAFFLGYVLLFNAVHVNIFPLGDFVPKKIFHIGDIFHLNQHWNMFSSPLKDNGWYVIPAKLVNGQEIDLFNEGHSLNWKKPSLVSTTYKNDRWRKYMSNLWWKSFAKYRPYYGTYLFQTWNNNHSLFEQVTSFKIYYMLQVTKEDNPHPPPEKTLLYANSFKPYLEAR